MDKIAAFLMMMNLGGGLVLAILIINVNAAVRVNRVNVHRVARGKAPFNIFRW